VQPHEISVGLVTMGRRVRGNMTVSGGHEMPARMGRGVRDLSKNLEIVEDPVGASLLAKAACQATRLKPQKSVREQARSHRGITVDVGKYPVFLLVARSDNPL